MVKHPAKYTDSFIPIFAEMLKNCRNVLDPFGGVGKLALIKDYGFLGKVVCNEIEKDWTLSDFAVDEWHVGDAANMYWAKDSSFDAVCTSPTYGNRMADHHNAKDNSKRITYKHYLGKDLNVENTGRMQWGKKYRDKHESCYAEFKRVLKPKGLLIINMSDHIRKGKIVNVVDWHMDVLKNLGFSLVEEQKIHTPRMKFGRNGNIRVNYEKIVKFTL